MRKMPGAQRDFINAKGTRYTKKAGFLGVKSKQQWFAMQHKADRMWMCMYGSEALGGSYTFMVAQTEGPPATAILIYRMARDIIEDIIAENKAPKKANKEGHSLH